MTIALILFASLLSYWLGQSASAAQSQWLLPFQTLLCLLCILCGLVAALCMLGLVILGNLLACWLTTVYSLLSIAQV